MTIWRGRRPIPATVITTAGRTLRISAPTEGSKSTCQISPRLGVGAVDIEVILAKSFKGGQLRIVPVFLLQPGRLLGEDCLALFDRQSAQFRCAPLYFRRGLAYRRRSDLTLGRRL